MEQDLESEGESDDLSGRVASCLGGPVEVLMGDVVFDPKGDPAALKPANGEETTPEAGKQKVDFIPPFAPKREPMTYRLTVTALTSQSEQR